VIVGKDNFGQRTSALHCRDCLSRKIVSRDRIAVSEIQWWPVTTARRNMPLRTFGLCVLLFVGPALQAQEQCNIEAKLLLSPTQTQAAIVSLDLKKETGGRVYFFDTSALDLLSHGLIIRLRQGADNDLTIKLRPPGGKKLSVASNVGETFNCEVDLIGDAMIPSYTVRRGYAATRLPETGTEISKLLDVGQEELLKQAQISIDWTRVKRIADIQSTSWQTKVQPGFDKLTLELWESPAARILELSAKAGPDAGPSTYKELQRLANTKGLVLNSTQKAKTSLALEMLTRAGH
jgi:hypothetical protein